VGISGIGVVGLIPSQRIYSEVAVTGLMKLSNLSLQLKLTCVAWHSLFVKAKSFRVIQCTSALAAMFGYCCS
jgi:hypothetical protein